MDRPDSSEAQRRRFARRPMNLPATLRTGGLEVQGVTENISPGGAFVRGQLPESTDEVVASISLPHGRELVVHAKVRWRRHGEQPGVGIEFAAFLQTPERDFKLVS
jgi:hypothetical protein